MPAIFNNLRENHRKCVLWD